MISATDRLADFPSTGPVPINDTRFATRDIRLASALCPLGFSLKLDKQPVAVTIDADREQRIVTFFHEDASALLPSVTARDVELWWCSPPNKYSIDGYDDALTAMRGVHEQRERMIAIAKGSVISSRGAPGAVATKSLHTASILRACEIPCIGYEARSRQWIFGKGAEVIAALIKAGGKPKEPRPSANDLCIDWMLETLRYRDWLARIVKNPDCIPLIEMRDGEKILQISAAMDEREQRKWMSYL